MQNPYVKGTLTKKLSELIYEYRRIPKVAAPVTFGISAHLGPLLSGSRYFRVAATFGGPLFLGDEKMLVRQLDIRYFNL